MGTFVVTTEQADPRVDQALAREFPNSYQTFAPNVWFLSATGTTQEVASKLGVKGRVEGKPFDGLTDIVVVKLAPSYWGFHKKDFWEWLQASLERDV